MCSWGTKVPCPSLPSRLKFPILSLLGEVTPREEAWTPGVCSPAMGPFPQDTPALRPKPQWAVQAQGWQRGPGTMGNTRTTEQGGTCLPEQGDGTPSPHTPPRLDSPFCDLYSLSLCNSPFPVCTPTHA